MAGEASSTSSRTQESRKRKLPHTRPQDINDAPQQTAPSPLFTQGQFALALCLQKSKPLELSTKDYVHQLRKRIKIGRQGEEQHRHVDTAEFWKDQYSKLLLEKNAWEQKAESLASNERDVTQPVALESAHDIAELNYRPFTCISLLRQTQKLVKQLTDANIDASTMSMNLQTTLVQMSSLITQICEPPKLLISEEGSIQRVEHIENAIHTVGLAYHQCLRGFKHLCRDIPGRQSKSVVIHSFSKLFSDILEHIHKMCKANVQSSKPLKKPKTPRPNTANETPQNGSFWKTKYDIINMSLSKLLVVMITSNDLNANSPGHVEILEGYLFHLLQHTGSTLSEVVFLEQVSPENTNGYGNSGDMTKTEPDPIARDKGRYLVYVLMQVIRNNPKVSEMLNNLPLKTHFTRGKKARPGDGLLSGDAKMRLQQTLLKSVFGGDDFQNSLKEPLNPEHETNAVAFEETAEPEQFSSEWFIESLWSLIGWDIFSENK